MHNIKRLLGYMFVPLLLIACNTAATFREVKVADQFRIKVADYLSPKKDTLLSYSLLLEDTVRGVILIVVKESKDSMRNYGLNYSLTSYYDKTIKSLINKLTPGIVSNYYPTTINENQAIVADIKGNNEDEKLYYKLAIIETPKSFYQLIYSTLQSNAAGIKQDMETSILSFKELQLVPLQVV